VSAVYRAVRELHERQCRKHQLALVAEAYATDKVNEMTNDELLAAISDALEELLPQLREL
jgi:uncharacterized protein YktB (UPF0637 family)